MLTDWRSRPPSDSGLSLVELLVVTLLLGIVGSVVVSGILAAFRSSTSTSTRVEATQELELAMQQIARDLRSTRFLGIVDDCGVRLRTQVARGGGDPYVIEYAFDSDEAALVTRRLDSAESLNESGATSQRSIVTRVDLGDAPLFVYLDADGNDIYPDGDCRTDDSDSRIGTRRVRIRLARQVTEGVVTVESEVGVRINRYLGDGT